jgi:hypothetical protein
MTTHNAHHRRRRERARPDRGKERKERVLHTRISERLADDIRDIAEDLRVPVSNLVRNVLEEAFAVVETVTENVGDLVEEVVEEAERARHSFGRRGRGSDPRRRDAAVDPDPLDFVDTERPVAPEPAASASAPRAEFPDVVGWQALILNREQSCADCEELIERSERGFAGVSTSGLSGVYLCGDCIDARQ